MREVGVVVSTSGLMAEVQFTRGPQCQGCHACDGFRKNNDLGTLLVRNGVGAKPGERVEVEIAPSAVLTSAFLVFVFPLLGLVAGYVLASAVFHASQGMAVLGAFVGLGGAFLALKLWDRFFANRKKTTPVIVRRVSGEPVSVATDPVTGSYWP